MFPNHRHLRIILIENKLISYVLSKLFNDLNFLVSMALKS